MKTLLLVAPSIIFMIIAGVVFPPYYISLLIFFYLYSVLAISYDILGGLLGYFNLGHIVSYGIGAYAFALALKVFPFTSNSLETAAAVTTALITATITASLYGFIFSYPLFRLRGFYFAVATLGLISLANLIASSSELAFLTGGFSGIALPREIVRYRSETTSYYLAAFILVLASIVYTAIKRSTFGLIFTSIKEDEEVADASGVDVFRNKQLALIVSSALAGLAGGVYMWVQTYTNPRFVFSLDIAFLPITMALLGGSGTVTGSVVGALILTIVYQLLLVNMPSLTKMVLGIVLIVIGIGFSDGLVGFGRKFLNHVKYLNKPF